MPHAAVANFLERFHGKRVALVCHVRPDGDALGSCIGLADALRTNGTPARVVNTGVIPDYLQFLTKDNDLVVQHQEADWYKKYDCLGVLDCGEESRLAPANQAAPQHLPTFTIDHHATSKGVGEAHWIDSGASSTGEMATDLIVAKGWTMSPLAANALWTAIVTDTGRFCYENTTAECMQAALVCLKNGANPSAIASEVYQSVTWQERILQRMVLDKMELHHDGKVAIACLTKEEFKKADSGVEGAQNLINLLRDTAGVEVAAFLYEPPEPGDPEQPIKVSLRTRQPYSALAIACRFGGGGHERAAGCSLAGGMSAARHVVLAAIHETWFR